MHIGTNLKKLDITKEKNTKKISEKFSHNLEAGDIVCLFGDLGVGKTTFIKYLINFIQKQKNQKISEVISPTFNILHEYQVKDLNILHYDLYRIKDIKELHNLGLFEEKKNSILLIEWPELIFDTFENIIHLKFEYESNFEKRTLIVGSKNKKTFIDEL